jgi:thiol-disulfide isomerase/thioredoxin
MKKRIAGKMILIGAAVLLLLAVPQNLKAAPPDKTISAELRTAFGKAGLRVLREKADSIDFTVSLLDGTKVKLSDYKGKIVFLNFWATWCPPCRAEMPSMESLHQKNRNDDFVILAVDIQESVKEVRDFMTGNGLTFTGVLDASGEVSGIYGIRSIPTTFIIDKNGLVILMSVGGRSWDTAEMYAAFDLLLKNGR